MPTYVCRVPCQVVMPEGGVRTFDAGSCWEFPTDFEVPKWFDNLDSSEGIDFITASEEELANAKWKFAEAKAAVSEALGVTLKTGTKTEIIRQILDARYRHEVRNPAPLS